MRERLRCHILTRELAHTEAELLSVWGKAQVAQQEAARESVRLAKQARQQTMRGRGSQRSVRGRGMGGGSKSRRGGSESMGRAAGRGWW